MIHKIFLTKCKLQNKITKGMERLLLQKSHGIDGLLVTVGLCIIALLLCVVMKDKLALFIETIITSLTNKATGILGGA